VLIFAVEIHKVFEVEGSTKEKKKQRWKKLAEGILKINCGASFVRTQNLEDENLHY
jgi:hypothetical protein